MLAVGTLVQVNWLSPSMRERHGPLWVVISDEEFYAEWGRPPEGGKVPIKSIATGQIYNTDASKFVVAEPVEET